MTAKLNIVQKRGDNRRVIFTIQNEDRLAIDITNWTAFVMTINSEKTPIDASNEITEQTGTILDGVNGKVAFPVDNTISVGYYYYDAQAVDHNGEIITFVEGQYIVRQDITKS